MQANYSLHLCHRHIRQMFDEEIRFFSVVIVETLYKSRHISPRLC